MNLPYYDQLRHYWCVSQGGAELPCAMFLLECDAKEWVEQQKSKGYTVVRPLAYKKVSV